jgi:alkylation response protein AidB-like acyl-CoA dehydrogenase
MDFNWGEDADMVRQTAHEFLRRDLLPREMNFHNAKTEEERRAIATTATDSLKEMGLYSAGVPEAFGGGGLGPIETCLIAEELGHTMIPVEWGEPTPILYECNDSQKAAYLKPVVEGTKHYAVAFSEPVPFSDPTQMQATATPDGDGYVLNGTKLLSRAEFGFCLVFASAIGPTGPVGPTCLIVDGGAPGTSLSGNQLTLANCAVSKDRILGQPGKALQLGRKWFALSRIVRAAAILGACDRLLEVSAQYAHDWLQMGQHISDRKPIQQALADIAGDVEALRWLVYHTAWLAAEGKKVEYDSMLLRLQADKVLADSVNRSVRIHGGTIPPIAEWLARRAADDGAVDSLRFAVSRETMSRILP